jgi:hypothetical protein
MTLSGEVIVFPGHGAGSACGKNIGKGAFCNIRNQKESNYALQAMDKKKFIDIVSSDIPAAP